MAGLGLPTTADVPVDAARVTAFPSTGLPFALRSVTVAVVPPMPSGATEATATVDLDGDTVSVPKVTDAVFERTVFSVTSLAVNVAVSAAGSVAVKVATPAEFVTFGVAVGVMTALPVPARVTV